jgi:transcriptional regulator with XRE-family HTH domain
MDSSTRKPNIVLRHQRMNRGWSQQKVAQQLDTTEDMISKWERGISKPSPFYQEKLCNLFNMTANELDLIDLPPTDQEHISALLINNLLENQAFLAQVRQSILQDFVKTASEIAGQSEHIVGYSRPNSAHLNEDLVVFFETMMLTHWNSYHTGGAERLIHGLNLFLKEIEKLSLIAQRTVWHQRILRLLTLGYQLQNCMLRDRLHYAQASIAYQKAFNIAQELEDDELLASALARQGVALVQQSKPKQAILYLDNALNIIDARHLPKLKGYILQALSEASAQDKRAHESWSYLGKAEAIIMQSAQEQSFIRFHPAATLAQKGVDAVFLEEYKDAIESIDLSLKSYYPTGISGRARLVAMKAEAQYKMGTLDACVCSAQEALTLAQAVGSDKIVARIKRLHADLQQSPWKEEGSIAQLGAMLYSPTTETE